MAEHDPHGGERPDHLLHARPADVREAVRGIEPLCHCVCEGEDIELPHEALLQNLGGRHCARGSDVRSGRERGRSGTPGGLLSVRRRF